MNIMLPLSVCNGVEVDEVAAVASFTGGTDDDRVDTLLKKGSLNTAEAVGLSSGSKLNMEQMRLNTSAVPSTSLRC